MDKGRNMADGAQQVTNIQTANAPLRIGVLVPFTNTNLEADMMRLLGPDMSIHFTRIGGYAMDEIPDSTEMAHMGEADISQALQLIAGVRPDVVLYGCTSATLTHGPDFDAALIDTIQHTIGVKAITAAGTLLTALHALGATRIGFASPYVGEVTQQAIEFLRAAGIKTVNRAEMNGRLGNVGQGAVTPDEVFELALRADHKHAEAIVLSCTDLRAVEAIERIENALGKPVVTSNQAMMFAVLMEFGLPMSRTGFGRLFNL